jgi:hypothetical protein
MPKCPICDTNIWDEVRLRVKNRGTLDEAERVISICSACWICRPLEDIEKEYFLSLATDAARAEQRMKTEDEMNRRRKE